MPFLYFATCRNDSNICAKFGHCKDESRLTAYKTTNLFFDHAVIPYNYTISKYRMLDNYIYDIVLRKNSTFPVVNFEREDQTKRKSDWFYTGKQEARRMLSYMKQLECLEDAEDFYSFSKNVLYIFTANPANAVPPGMNVSPGTDILQLKEAQARIQWKPEYRHVMRTKTVNMCKSCKNRAYVGCCPEYSQANRKKVVAIIGWQLNVDDPLWFGGHSKQPSTFFERNYTKGGMISIKKVRRHVEWKEAYADDVVKRDVNMCKSCNATPAYGGCCPEYSEENRKKIRMIIGWS